MEEKCVLISSWKSICWVASSFFGLLRWPVLCADCSGWALCLWMLAGAMCHVLCILRLVCFHSKHTVCLCGNGRAVRICLFPVFYSRQMQWFKIQSKVYVIRFKIFTPKHLKRWCQCCVAHSSVECWAVSRICLARSHIKSVELASDDERQTFKWLRFELQNRKQQAFLWFFFVLFFNL